MVEISSLCGLLEANWNPSAISKPNIGDITSHKAVDVNNDGDWILAYPIAYNEEYIDFRKEFIRRSTTVSFDIRTAGERLNGKQIFGTGRAQMDKLVGETRRIVYANRKDPVSGWDSLSIVRQADKSDKSRNLFRKVIDVEMKSYCTSVI